MFISIAMDGECALNQTNYGGFNGEAGDQGEGAAKIHQRSDFWADWFRQQPNDLERCNGEKDLQACRCQSRNEEMNTHLSLSVFLEQPRSAEELGLMVYVLIPISCGSHP